MDLLSYKPIGFSVRQQRSDMSMPILQIEQPRKAHLVGICGAGMRAVAELLSDFGWTMTGSDQAEPEIALNVGEQQLRFHLGHTGSHITADTDVLIFSPAVAETNPERVAARQRGIPEFSYSQFLGALMRERTGLAVAGTHGKTTTAAMLAVILREAGLSPSASIGGEVAQYDRSGWGGQGPLFVAESCEYRRHFLDHSPASAAILGIEPDHFDCFPDWESQLAAFSGFAARVHQDGVLVVPADSRAVAEAAAATTAQVETTRVVLPVDSQDADSSDTGRGSSTWLAHRIRQTECGYQFSVKYNGAIFCETELCIPGRHNIENSLAAIALAHSAGVSAETISATLPEFQGVRRRFEILRTPEGLTLVDDYAHHPTAVQATISAAKEFFPDRRLIVAFQPHQISRTRELMARFATSFGAADELFLLPIFAARERSADGDTVLARLAESIAGTGLSVHLLASLDRLKSTLEDVAHPDNVVLILGAGNISRIAHEFASGNIPGNYAG